MVCCIDPSPVGMQTLRRDSHRNRTVHRGCLNQMPEDTGHVNFTALFLKHQFKILIVIKFRLPSMNNCLDFFSAELSSWLDFQYY